MPQKCNLIHVVGVTSDARYHNENGLRRGGFRVRDVSIPVKTNRSAIWHLDELPIETLSEDYLLKCLIEDEDQCLHPRMNSIGVRPELHLLDRGFSQEVSNQGVLL